MRRATIACVACGTGAALFSAYALVRRERVTSHYTCLRQEDRLRVASDD